MYQLQAGPSGVTGLVDCHGAPTATEYYITAVPTTFQGTGNRGFASNHNNSIWQDTTGVAPVEPFTAGGTVSQID
jgi:hypothetical protein